MNVDYVVLSLYYGSLSVLCFFGLHRFFLLVLYLKHCKERQRPIDTFTELPTVTVQLAMFNEMYVAEKLIDTICDFDYPRDKLQIQVVDDSTDDTVQIVSRAVKEKSALGFDIEYVHRKDRTGFKAGALANGLKTATGEFVAMFDADFDPPRDWLMKVIHYFTDENIGLVQTRWEHINRDSSLLTKAQALMLDGQFAIEHPARQRSGAFFNFNGTAGIWRRRTIDEAGGWSHDTLTEDMDLSLRAYIKGWRSIYLDFVTAPAELPTLVSAYKVQQHRWAKGFVESARKLVPVVWRSNMPLPVKVEATIQLCESTAWFFVISMMLTAFPAMIIRLDAPSISLLYIDLPIFLAGMGSFCVFFTFAAYRFTNRWVSRAIILPFVMALGTGIALSNSKGVFEALLGYKTEFVRTPKFNVSSSHETVRLKKKKYLGVKSMLPLLELSLAVFFMVELMMCLRYKLWLTIPFFSIFFIGNVYVGFLSLTQGRSFFGKGPAGKGPDAEDKPESPEVAESLKATAD